jgi:hypothetical protein
MKKLEPKKYPIKEISWKLVPRDYFIEEDKHLVEIGVRIKQNTNINAEGIYEGRLYFDNKQTLNDTIKDLKTIGVIPVIRCGLTRIIIYTAEQSRLLYYYIKGREIDSQGILKKY